MIRKSCRTLFSLAALPWMGAVALAQEPAPAPPPAVEAEPELPAIVQVTGVNALVDYAAMERLLGTVAGVRRVDVTEAEGAKVNFRVLVRGGSAALEHALEGSAQLARESAGVYSYRR